MSGAKDTQGKFDRQPRGLLNGPTDCPTEKDYLHFFWGMMKRWDCCWWRWWVENHNEATDLCGSKWVPRIFLFALRFYSQIWPTKLLPPSSGKGGGFSPHISQVKRWGRGQELDGRYNTIDGWGWILGPSQTYMNIHQNRAFNYFVTGENE
jgi:hypothetical protein